MSATSLTSQTAFLLYACTTILSIYIASNTSCMYMLSKSTDKATALLTRNVKQHKIYNIMTKLFNQGEKKI